MQGMFGKLLGTVLRSVAGSVPGTMEGPEETIEVELAPDEVVKIENLSGSTSVCGMATKGETSRAVVKYKKVCFGLSEEEARRVIESTKLISMRNGKEVCFRPETAPGVFLRGVTFHIWADVPSSCSVSVNASSGSIKLDGMANGIEAKTASGSVKAYNCSGLVRLSSQSGSVTLKGGKGDFRLSSTSGSVNASDVIASSLDAHCTSGSIHVSVSPKAGTAISARSVSGSVSITVPSEVAARVACKTVSGSCSVNLPCTYSIKTRNRIEGSCGDITDGTNLVNIRGEAVSGSVRIGT